LLKLEGQIIHFFAFFRTRYVFCKILEHIFFKQKTYPPPYKLNGRSLSKNYVNSNIVFFSKEISHQVIYTNFK